LSATDIKKLLRSWHFYKASISGEKNGRAKKKIRRY
jgi:hypothetical protein